MNIVNNGLETSLSHVNNVDDGDGMANEHLCFFDVTEFYTTDEVNVELIEYAWCDANNFLCVTGSKMYLYRFSRATDNTVGSGVLWTVSDASSCPRYQPFGESGR